MDEIKYQVTHKSGSKMLFKYSLKGFLKGFSTEMEVTHATIQFFKQQFPFLHSGLEYFNDHKEFRVEKIDVDLSFVNFWNLYTHKVGNKKRCEKLWSALSENDRAKAISYIKRYDNYLIGAGGIQKAHPETYLYQRRFDNE